MTYRCAGWWLLISLVVLMAMPAPAADMPPIKPSPTVVNLLDDPLTDDALRIFFGRWDGLEHPTVEQQAQIALQRYDLSHPSLIDPAVSPAMRAQAARLRGDPRQAIAILESEPPTPEHALILARCLIDTGQFNEATQRLIAFRETNRSRTWDDPRSLTAAAELLVLLARLEGRPAQDYHQAMDMLGRVRNELDMLYWPACVAEAALLMGKDNNPDALAATLEALALNPRASVAWYHLGQLSVDSFQFDKAAFCIDKLREINDQHLLADLLAIRSHLAQKDIAGARQALASARQRYPDNREVAALRVAVLAMAYRDDDVEQAQADFQRLAPDNASACLLAGKYLSLARQYDDGEAMLRQAIAMQPNWPEPRVELGLLLMQSGDEPAAHEVLQTAAPLDPFNRRAANQLALVEKLLAYERIETEHFTIKYRYGIDEVLARDMPDELERIYDDITAIFAHRPQRRTLIEILPDEQHFGVRITGIPEIWTIAASTGDVIALTPPRPGAKQRGVFDWARVIRHEFVHTVTLDQTSNRIPHWFTEACAVSVEPGDRDYMSCQLLAKATIEDELFDLDEINWAFVRPRRPQDRPLAYAQAHWMLEYITTHWGHRAIVAMLSQFHDGATTQQAIAEVTGEDADAFMASFDDWARDQVRQWGLGPHETIKGVSQLDATAVEALLAQHPDHPDLLKRAAQLATERGDAEAARRAVLRYEAARPVDPWSHEMLAQLAAATGRPHEAIAAMEQLDRQEQSSGRWSYQLAQAYRRSNMLDRAAGAAERALHREPYNGTFRELAATIALQRGDRYAALHQLESIALLEPDRAIHFVRLAAMYQRLGDIDRAKWAAARAIELDPDAPVAQFLESADQP
jgi:predicted Zn-dependent protease